MLKTTFRKCSNNLSKKFVLGGYRRVGNENLVAGEGTLISGRGVKEIFGFGY